MRGASGSGREDLVTGATLLCCVHWPPRTALQLYCWDVLLVAVQTDSPVMRGPEVATHSCLHGNTFKQAIDLLSASFSAKA